MDDRELKESFDKFYDELISIFKDLYESLKKDLPSIGSSESEVTIDEQKQ